MCYARAMARLDPFTAIRYDPSRVRADDVVSPPYDVVGPTERARLAARSPYNAIHVELPEPSEAEGLDRYQHAARLVNAWLDEGVLGRDADPAFHLYQMTFDDELGRRRVTTGLLGALGIDPDGTGQVLPHEQTIPKDRHDRLSLLRATRANLSPIWGLSLAKGLTAACLSALETSAGPGWRATDDDGVVHETFPVTDPDVIGAITALAASAPVLIADGHHRYETACAYAAECRASNGDRPGGHDLVLALVVELAEEELSVRAIHRLVRGVDAAELPGQLAPFFVVEPVSGDPDGLPGLMAESGALGLVTRAGNFLLAPLPELEAATEDDLDSSRLNVVLAALGEHELVYQPGAREVVAAVEGGRADAGFLVRPVTVAQIARVAHGGRRMQPKSTFFHPKPRTGMAFRPLD